MPAPQFALCHHQPGLGLVLLARHASHRACVALRLSELVDFVVESCLVGGQDTFADCFTSLIHEYRGSPVSNTGLSEDRGLAGYQESTVEKHISSILIKLNLQEADDDHRRVLAVITFLKAR